jgi:alpha-L-rhamnosidase
MLAIANIRVNHLEKPLGLDDRNPVFSWRIESDVPNTVQTRYRITVSSPKEIVWENSVESRSSAAVPYAGKALESRERYHVTVTVEDNHGVSCTGETDFEMGLFREDWKAKWVEAEHKTSQGPHLRLLQSPSKEMLESIEETMSAPTVFSSSFSLKGEILRARLYLTAHGTYRFSVNGSLCSDRYFAPEFTPYDKLLYFQT